MVIWVVAAAWLALAVPVLVVFVAMARAGHEEDVVNGYVGRDVPVVATPDLHRVAA